jgi:molecular chaperone Hsp33
MSQRLASAGSDRLLRFTFPRDRVRGQIVRLESAWKEVARRHRTHESREISPNLRQRLGELSAAGLLLSASLKFDGALVLQIQSQGPVALFVVECESDGRFRATVKIREGSRIVPDASLSDLLRPLHQARFAVTLIPSASAAASSNPLSAPYQGIVPFEGDTVAELLENYMERSEQVPTRLWLAADDERAFGLLLQRMPGDGGNRTTRADDDAEYRDTASPGTAAPDRNTASPGTAAPPRDTASSRDEASSANTAPSPGDAPFAGMRGRDGSAQRPNGDESSPGGDRNPDAGDEGWNRILALTGTLSRAEMLECPVEELLIRLFWESAPTVFEGATPRFVCNCSRHKVESMLKLLGRAEVDSIVREQGLVEVRCEFCGEEYLLGADEARALFS